MTTTIKTTAIQPISTTLPTQYGNFQIMAFPRFADDPMPHLVMVAEGFSAEKTTLVRIHSECITGDLFGSKRCDCGQQLQIALQLAAKEGGMVVYLRQEGRGIGIVNKLKAYNLQDQGLDTIDANVHLGLEVDARQYDVALSILQSLGVQSIRLLTNNPEKINAIELSNIRLVERVPLIIPAEPQNESYLKTKEDLMGHLLGQDNHE
jgi:GTP cyclohydrolase II